MVIAPFRIPLPRFASVLVSKLFPRLRKDHDRRLHFPVNFVSAPVFGVFFLWAAQCIDGTIVRNGIVGIEGIKPLDIMALFISLVRHRSSESSPSNRLPSTRPTLRSHWMPPASSAFLPFGWFAKVDHLALVSTSSCTFSFSLLGLSLET